MKIGLVGKPNVGKSTFFAAATLVDAEIGNYPFTTIDANRGMAYVRVPDPGADLGVTSTPRTGKVVGPTRYVPVELIDVAGLVPGAHAGKGLGNKFLGDLSRADALVHVVDATGATDGEGNPVDPGAHDPLDDVAFLQDEIDQWIAGILRDGWDKLARRVQQENGKVEAAIAERLSGVGVDEVAAKIALRDAGLMGKLATEYEDADVLALARAVRGATKPITVALNKADLVDDVRLEGLREGIDAPCFAVSAQSELALARGNKAGVLRYDAGAAEYEAVSVDEKQKKGLEYIRAHVLDRLGSTGVHQALEHVVFEQLELIPVFPVEDEHKFTDKDGRVLPDCHLVPAGTTAKQLAYRVHTDLGEHFIRGVDCRTGRTIGADHELAAGDVIRIAAHT